MHCSESFGASRIRSAEVFGKLGGSAGFGKPFAEVRLEFRLDASTGMSGGASSVANLATTRKCKKGLWRFRPAAPLPTMLTFSAERLAGGL